MSEDKLLPHVENLVPGLVIVTVLTIFFNLKIPVPIINPELFKLLADPVIAGILLVAISYQIGVIAFIFSRIFVDLLSEWTFRWMLLKAFDYKTFKGKKCCEINEAYRLAVKNSKENLEVRKRRERGRLVRCALVPLILLASKCCEPFWSIILSIFAVVLLYAFAEVFLYKEAKLAA